jgi:hypothetical protein
MGRPLRDISMHYSADHERLLRFCAGKANRVLADEMGFRVDRNELMAEGWWQCLRRVPPGALQPAIANTIRSMVNYGIAFYVEHNGHPRSRAVSSLEDTDLRALDLLPGHEPDPAYYPALADEIRFLQEHLEHASFELVQNLAAGNWSARSLAQDGTVSRTTIDNRRRSILTAARQILEAA